MRQMEADFAYDTNMKVIWDRRKANLALNQCLNVNQLARLGDSVNNWTIQSILGCADDGCKKKYLDRPGWHHKYQVYQNQEKMSKHQIRSILHKFGERQSQKRIQ